MQLGSITLAAKINRISSKVQQQMNKSPCFHSGRTHLCVNDQTENC